VSSQKYSVNQHLIETILAWVKSGEIAIPEIQRPFVWDATKVRDLMDSLSSFIWGLSGRLYHRLA
jgi:uncharacterized protein with ParB-like and HNH nuclease domain